MKTLKTLCLLFATPLVMSQVGIGTTTPEADLHVVGDALIQDTFKVGSLGTVSSADEDFKLITRTTNTTPVGQITVLDVNTLNVAPVNVVNYSFTNISLDNLTDLDLQFDDSKYVVGVANFRYEGDAIKKVPGGTTKSIGNFVVRTFTSGGSWHLEIRNRTLDLSPGDTVNYHVTLIIYDKSYYRNLTPIVTDLGGSNTGIASSVPNLY
ncbi:MULTISPECIES: hypothetical protein [Altibacter]|uniref:hypothetical protein n=1 Tax=Altibacter TaxID=1535231 RepID=UPI0012697E27|nr:MULTISPECIES: hypothetical protein [Altibacter]MCW9036551.1 hypothetical protein [Altibacter sp.]